MKILIDIGHPAHVHLFKNFAHEMIQKGHQLLFTLRQKEFTDRLLQKYRFEYVRYGSSYSGIAGKLWGLLKFNVELFKIVRKYKPDITLSHSSFYLAQVSWLLGIKNITLEDTGNMEQIILYKPFANCILSPDCYTKNHGKKHLFYKGYHELSYLHPNRFTPNPAVLNELGVEKDEPFVILRFISWDASHDLNHTGLSSKSKITVVEEFSKYARVFISSQKELPKELESFKIPVDPDKIHDAMAFAKLLWGESATMAAESAVLGVPAIYLDNTGRYYTKEIEEKYGLIFNFSESEKDQSKAIKKGIEILSMGSEKEKIKKNHQNMINDKIDVTAFLTWLVENYPSSVETLKKEPDYAERFK